MLFDLEDTSRIEAGITLALNVKPAPRLTLSGF
jgi:hypothetical protein